MKKLINKLSIQIVICLLFAIPSVINLFNNPGFSFHDETQIVNLHQYVKAFDNGQFPPRWSPDMEYTYGSPYPEFNYQLPYYFGYLFHKIGFSLIHSYLLVLGLSLLLGAVGMYLLGLNFSTPLYALAGSVLYTYTPYRSVDVYVRGTIGEALALGLFPWILLGLFKLLKHPSLRTAALSGFFIGLLILTHQPATVLGLPFFLLIVFGFLMFKKRFNDLKYLLLSLIIAVGFSAYYLFPTLIEMRYIQPVVPFNFVDHFPFLWQLVYSRWGYGVSVWGPYDGLSFRVGFINLALIVIALLVFIKKQISGKDKDNQIILGLTLVSLFLVFFFMNARSEFLWKIFPYTNSIQFPWRLLMVVAFLTSLLLLILSKYTWFSRSKIVPLAVIVLSFVFNLGLFHPGTIVSHTDKYYLRRYLPNQVVYEGERFSKDYANYTEEYLPLPTKAVRPKTTPDKRLTAGLTTALIDIKTDTPYFVEATVKGQTEDDYTFNTYYFPGWVIKVNGVVTKPSLNYLGAMVIHLGAGDYHLTLAYHDTTIRRVSNIISLATIIILIQFIIYYLYEVKTKRRS